MTPRDRIDQKLSNIFVRHRPIDLEPEPEELEHLADDQLAAASPVVGVRNNENLFSSRAVKSEGVFVRLPRHWVRSAPGRKPECGLVRTPQAPSQEIPSAAMESAQNQQIVIKSCRFLSVDLSLGSVDHFQAVRFLIIAILPALG